MEKVVYVCTGGCGGVVSEEQYFSGKNSCAMSECPRYARPLEKRVINEEEKNAMDPESSSG